jgi:hypothetical protein
LSPLTNAGRDAEAPTTNVKNIDDKLTQTWGVEDLGQPIRAGSDEVRGFAEDYVSWCGSEWSAAGPQNVRRETGILLVRIGWMLAYLSAKKSGRCQKQINDQISRSCA